MVRIEFLRPSAGSFALSLAIALYVPIQRAWSSFDTEKLDKVGWFMQRSAIGLAILGVGLIAVGVFYI